MRCFSAHHTWTCNYQTAFPGWSDIALPTDIGSRYVGVPLLYLMGDGSLSLRIDGSLCLMGGGIQGGREQLPERAAPVRDLFTSGLTSKPFSRIHTHSVSYCLGLDKLGLEEEQEEEVISWRSSCSSKDDLEEYIEGWERCKSAPLPRTAKLYRRVITSIIRPKTGGALLTSSRRH